MNKDEKFFSTKKMVLMALLIAMSVTLSRVLGLYIAMSATTKRISFASIPIFLGSIYLGPIYGGIIGAMTDVIGSLLFPKGAFNPLFTIAPLLNGIIPGLIVGKSYKNLPFKIILACIIQSVIANVLNSYFLTILYGKNTFIGHLYGRIPFGVVMILVKSIILIPMVYKMKGFINKQKSILPRIK